MWHDSRRGFNLIRKRANDRSNKRRIKELSVIACFIVTISVISIYGIFKLGKNEKVIETVSNVDIYKEKDIAIKKEENKDKKDETKKADNDIKDKEAILSITALGEIMMGGKVRNNLDSYSLAFKEISTYTSKADYTVSNLSTNITTVEDLSNSKSKYIVNSSIINAFNALGIDGMNIATDHMLDFSSLHFTNTVSILKQNDVDVIGMKNEIVYVEKDGIRVAIIGVNNVVIGVEKAYTDVGMYIYNLESIKKSIEEARTKADTVIVMTHYGKENTHQITDVMKWFTREIIDAGADLVLGGHSLGIYPIEEYNGKLILYSLGYLMHDTDYEVGKKSAIFNIDVTIDGKIKQISLLPTYIDSKKSVKLYKDINEKENEKFINELKNTSNVNTYDIYTENGKLIYKIKN